MSPPEPARFKPFVRPARDESAAERALLLGGEAHGASGVPELLMARLREMESLLQAYETGHILVVAGDTSADRRCQEDPIRELRGRIAAAQDFIRDRLPDIAPRR